MWLCGAAPVIHHMLPDFRADHKAGLDELFQQLLVVLNGSGRNKSARTKPRPKQSWRGPAE